MSVEQVVQRRWEMWPVRYGGSEELFGSVELADEVEVEESVEEVLVLRRRKGMEGRR